jgi:putative transposase
MERDEVLRRVAVQRFEAGESAETICSALKRSKSWLYKWVERSTDVEPSWYEDHSRRPHGGRRYADEAILEMRKHLEEEGNFVGAQSIYWELKDQGAEAPSVATIKRILKRAGLTSRKRRVPKGTRYPAPLAMEPGAVQQADFIGPRHVANTRFYSLNVVDVATARAAAEPIRSRATDHVIPGFWSVWMRLGIPRILQLDNELVFSGNRRSPRAMGQFLRLCLDLGVELLFIPIREPWRNSVVEKFNDHWNRKLYRRIRVGSFEELRLEALSFEQRHNSRWRYTKLQGKTPNAALAASNVAIRLPERPTPPSLPYERPSQGRVSLVRLIRSDRCFDVFGERFELPPEATYEYVKGTVDVMSESLTVSLHDEIIEQFPYRLPSNGRSRRVTRK